MVQFFMLVVLIGTVGGCAGAGVTDAEEQARAAQTKTMGETSIGFSIWSMSSGNEEAVRKRLDVGLGKSKTEEIVTFGQPFRCNLLPRGGEVCGWYDAGMSDGGTTDSNQHRVFYTFDQSGKANDWNYQGAYGKHSSRDASLPSPGTPSPENK